MLLTTVCSNFDEIDNHSNSSIVILATKGPRQPRQPDSIYEWIQQSLISRKNLPFMTLGDILKKWSAPANGRSSSDGCAKIAPRTAMFASLSATIRPDMTSTEFVEAMLSAGMDSLVLETLPEAISAPMREAIAECQAQPPLSWNEDLLHLVGRDDLISLAQKRKDSTSSFLKVITMFQCTRYK